MDDLIVDDGNSHAVAKDTDDDIGDVDCSVDEGNGGDTGGGGGGGGGWTRSHWLSGMHASVSQYSITTDEFLGTGIGLIPPSISRRFRAVTFISARACSNRGITCNSN